MGPRATILRMSMSRVPWSRSDFSMGTWTGLLDNLSIHSTYTAVIGRLSRREASSRGVRRMFGALCGVSSATICASGRSGGPIRITWRTDEQVRSSGEEFKAAILAGFCDGLGGDGFRGFYRADAGCGGAARQEFSSDERSDDQRERESAGAVRCGAESDRGDCAPGRTVFGLVDGRSGENILASGRVEAGIRASVSRIKWAAAFCGAGIYVAGQELRYRGPGIRGGDACGAVCGSAGGEGAADQDVWARRESNGGRGAGCGSILRLHAE